MRVDHNARPKSAFCPLLHAGAEQGGEDEPAHLPDVFLQPLGVAHAQRPDSFVPGLLRGLFGGGAAPVAAASAIAAAGNTAVGGSDADFERGRPLFEAMGKTITHIGPVGDGQTAKLANQIAVGLTVDDLDMSLDPPVLLEAGPAFAMVRLNSHEALKRATIVDPSVPFPDGLAEKGEERREGAHSSIAPYTEKIY